MSSKLDYMHSPYCIPWINNIYTCIYIRNNWNNGILFLDEPNSGYSAEINRLGDESSINYEFVLRISNVTNDMESKTIYMSAKENTGPSEEGEETSPK